MSKIAVLQMTSGIDPQANADAIARGMADAHEGGAGMLFAPEMALLLDRDRKRATATMEDPDYPGLVDRLCAAAKDNAI